MFMAWEILHDDNQKQAAFYCNTVDVAFGPTFSTYDYDLDVGVFYKWWDSSVGKDPRNMENSDIRSKIREWEWLQRNPQITVCFTQGEKKVVLKGTFYLDWNSVDLPIYSEKYDFDEDTIGELEDLISEIHQSIIHGDYSENNNQFQWAITGIPNGYNGPIFEIPCAIEGLMTNKLPTSEQISNEAIDINQSF